MAQQQNDNVMRRYAQPAYSLLVACGTLLEMPPNIIRAGTAA